MMAMKSIEKVEDSNKGKKRATKNTPAATIVAAWIKALTGVGPSIASGNHVCKGNCPDFPIAPKKIPIVIIVIELTERILIANSLVKSVIKNGFKDVNQLKGGIIQYAHDIKNNNKKSKFIGKNFVFDARMGERVTNDIIGKCHQCGNPADRHLDCGNDACHILFIQCDECYATYSGCCSKECEAFAKLPVEKQRILRKDPDKVVSNARYSSRIKPKLTEIRQS